MAQVPAVTRFLVVDTGYLLELYRVPGKHDPAKSGKFRERWAEEIELGSSFFVPFPVVFELCNHVAQVKDGSLRHRLAEIVAKDLRQSQDDDGGRWVLTMASDGIAFEAANLLELMDDFEKSLAVQNVGLADAAVLHQAQRLKKKYPGGDFKIHIWTTDAKLKAMEPDREEDPPV